MSADVNRLSPDHTPRTRSEILSAAARHADRTKDGSWAAQVATLEVLLDCRDLLAEIAVGISEIRSNTS